MAAKKASAKASAKKAHAKRPGAKRAGSLAPAARTSKARASGNGTDGSAAIDAFLRALDHPLKPVLAALRALVLAVDPRIEEEIKWNAPSFRTSEHFATTNVRGKDAVLLVLHCGAKARETAISQATIDDPSGLLEWLAKDRCVVRFHDLAAVRAHGRALAAILRQWIAQMPA